MTIEQKQDLVKYRVGNARKTLDEVEILMQNNLYNTAINRLYYACFYAVTALLLQNDIKSKTHSGARQMLGMHFIDTGIIPADSGTFYTKIFTMRHKGDYEDFIDYEYQDTLVLIEPARKLIAEIEAVLPTIND